MLRRFRKLLDDTVSLAVRAVGFIRRDPKGFLTLTRMACWVTVFSLLVRVLPLPRALRIITPRPRSKAECPAEHQVGAPTVPGSAVSQERLAQLIDLLLGLNLLVFTPTCWKRAAVLHRYLALSGTQTQIVFGVRKENEGLLEGHAWLEAGRQPILEKNPPHYRITYSFPVPN